MNTFTQMIDRGHEAVCFHHDPETGLRSIIAVHSTALGPAFGGVRRWHYATEADALYDVLRLSEAMSYKAAVANVPMGGGKAVIMLPKSGQPATEAEARAMGRFVHSLNGRYIGAEDVGLTPQYADWMAQETSWVTGGLTSCPGGDPAPHTAQGVVNAMKAALAHTGRPVEFAGLTVAIQGVGNVGRNVARILHGLGAALVVADINDANVQLVVDRYAARAVAADAILTTRCDILAPCALGGVIDAGLIRRLHCSIICGGANNILDDADEDGVALEASDILFVPDFVANAGGVIELAGAYLGMAETQRRERIAEIEQTTLEVLRDARSKTSTSAAAVDLARRRIAKGCTARVAPDVVIR